MNRTARALAFWLLLPQAAWSAAVFGSPRTALPAGSGAAAAPSALSAPVLGNAAQNSPLPVPSLTSALSAAPVPVSAPALTAAPEVQAPALPAPAAATPVSVLPVLPAAIAPPAVGEATAQAASRSGAGPAAEQEQSAGRALFDGSGLRVDSFDTVLAPGAGAEVAATPRGVRVRLEAGDKVRLLVTGQGRQDAFTVWKDAAGLRIRRQGDLRSRAVPEKGFYIFRGPAGQAGADRTTISDRSLPEARLQAAVSAEDGQVLVQDAGAITLHRNDVSVLIQGVRPEGAFPIQKALTPAGHAFAHGAIRYVDETVAVDWERDAALRGFYERVRARLGARQVGANELAALHEVFDAVVRGVKYDEAEVTARIERLGGRRGVLLGELMGLSGEDSCPAVGVCRHMALLLGAVLERLIAEGDSGLAGGKVYYVGGKGHAWAVYRDAAGGFHVLDAAQRRDEVPLAARTSYSGDHLGAKGDFAYAEDMAPELKREWRAGLPSRWSEAAQSLADLARDAAGRLRRLFPDRSRDEVLRRRLAEIRDMGRGTRD